MTHLNKSNKKEEENDSIVTAKKAATTTLAAVTTIMLVIVGATTAATIPLGPHGLSAAEATTEGFSGHNLDLATQPKAPMAVSEDGNNIYIVCWTNRSGNCEVMFRASNDGGETFSDRINLSNSSNAESQNAEIVAAGEDSVFVTWWETNAETGSSESVLRVSTDAGQTFSPVMMLDTNGTLSTAETATTDTNTTTTTAEGRGEEEEGETVDEEAVGETDVAE